MARFGWILRIYPLYRRDVYRLVIKLDDDTIIRDISYHPKIYLTGKPEDLKELLIGLDASNYLVDYGYEEWYIPPWYRRLRKILYVALPGPKEYREVLDWIRSDGRYILWNTYPGDTQQMMYSLNISASTMINVDDLSLAEDPWSIEYTTPPFRRVRLRILDWYGDVLHPFKYRPKRYIAEFYSWGETREYSDFYRLIDDIAEYRPDIFEFLNTPAYHWFRSKDRIFRDWNKVYIDYGFNVLEPDEYHGFIELSRLSRVDIHDVSRYSIGKILTTIEAYYAFDLKRLIPDVRTDMEGFKTLDKLSTVDRGGYIHSPRPGIYWNVAQCDFTSLYPSIIVKYNIGNETVNYYKCRNYITVPESRHRICFDIPATVAYTVEKILSRRILLKDMARATGDPILNARQNALKWILVTCFGYLGYRNARFGKIEAYECVTSYARDIMYKAMDVAREMGFNIIHVLVDSIWIYRDDATLDDYLEYCRRVYRETGFRMELDSYYKWLYIPPSRNGSAAINRYVGVLQDGSIKAKGIELIRRDTPGIVKEIQEKILRMFADASNEEDIARISEEVMHMVRRYLEDIRRGDIEPSRLIITRRLSKEMYEYIARQPHVEAGRKLGIERPYIVRYIITSSGAIPVEKWREGMGYDIRYYVKLVRDSLKTFEMLLKPKGLYSF